MVGMHPESIADMLPTRFGVGGDMMGAIHGS